MEFEIKLDYTVEDLEAYWRAFVWKRPGTPSQKRASPRMHRNVGLVFLVMGAVSWIWVTPLMGIPELILGGLLIYSGWYLGRPGAASRWAKKTWEKYQASGRLYQCRFTGDGVWVHSSRSDHRYDYEFIEALWEDADCFYLEISSKTGTYILNKAKFTAGDPANLPTYWTEQTRKTVRPVSPGQS